MQLETKLEEGWYLCILNNKEIQMYYDGGKWHLSAYDTHDVVHRRIAKNPDVVLEKMSR
jgi:hypothetical protein